MADNLTLVVGEGSPSISSCPLPRVTIKFCTQCKWMLRAAYFAQELLSTFSTALGEVALQPSTGGVFVVEIIAPVPAGARAVAGVEDIVAGPEHTVIRKILWDRKVDGGFPETKELKRRVRDVIQPDRDLGHVDRDHARPGDKKAEEQPKEQQLRDEPNKEEVCVVEGTQPGDKKCEDCQ